MYWLIVESEIDLYPLCLRIGVILSAKSCLFSLLMVLFLLTTSLASENNSDLAAAVNCDQLSVFILAIVGLVDRLKTVF